MSDEDFGLLYQESFEQKAHEFLQTGVQIFIITLGAEGAIAFTKDKSYKVEGVKVKLVDTVGAGDTFQASCIAHIAHHGLNNIEIMLLNAVKAASITCSRAGANLPYAKELL
jgi:fructokinase